MNKTAVGWPDTDHPRNPSGWAWAPNLMPPVGPSAWPRGIQRNANEAESILSEAVAWWDPTVSDFRVGGRWLRNSGTAAGLLDLRLGSSTVANTNDPYFVEPQDVGYCYVANTGGATGSGNYLTVSDATSTNNDLDVKVEVAPDNWFSGAKVFIARSETGLTIGWRFIATGTGILRFTTSVNGTALLNYSSTVAVPFASNQKGWVRYTRSSSTGDIKFYTSVDGSTWTQLGDTVAGVTGALFDSTDVFALGQDQYGISVAVYQPYIGKYYRVTVATSIDGTPFLDINFDAITSGSATSFTAVTSQTVTITRQTSGRKTVAMPARRLGGRACFLFGTDDYMEVVDNWQHQLLNFGPLQDFSVAIVRRRWASGTSYGGLIGKRQDSSANGWCLDENFRNQYDRLILVPDGTNLGAEPSSFGPVQTTTVTRAAASGRLYANTGAVSFTSSGDLRNTLPVRVGRDGGSIYGNFEFRAAAVFRRALTAREISVLSTYYSGG